MGYYSNFQGSYTFDRPLTESEESNLSKFLEQFVGDFTVETFTIGADGPRVSEICPNGYMKGYDFNQDLCKIVRFIKENNLPEIFGEVERSGEEAEDLEKIEIHNMCVYTREGKVEYGKAELVEEAK